MVSIVSLNERDIPELQQRRTVLIYDALRGALQPLLPAFSCHIFVFASPTTYGVKTLEETNGLVRFVCPHWTPMELQALAHGYGNRVPPEEVAKRYRRFGGSPRAVVVNPLDVSESLTADAFIALQRLMRTMGRFDGSTLPVEEHWPSSLWQASYATTAVATTARGAYVKYQEAANVLWDYSCERAKETVHTTYERIEDTTAQRAFERWLLNNKKATVG